MVQLDYSEVPRRYFSYVSIIFDHMDERADAKNH